MHDRWKTSQNPRRAIRPLGGGLGGRRADHDRHHHREHQRCTGGCDSRCHRHARQQPRAPPRSPRRSPTPTATTSFRTSRPTPTSCASRWTASRRSSDRACRQPRRPRRTGDAAIEVGGLDETVTVAAEAAADSVPTGERSFTVATDSVQNLPISNRSFTSLTALAPGVDSPTATIPAASAAAARTTR